MNKPKRHHYLPQFYLSSFCKGGKLWLFDRERGEYRSQTPINTAVQKDFYTVENEEGEKSPVVENHLSEIEGMAKTVIEKLARKERIDQEEKENLSLFLGLFQTRTPEFREVNKELMEALVNRVSKIAFGSEELAAAGIKRYEKNTGKQLGLSAKELSEHIQEAEFSVQIDQGMHIKNMITIGVEIGGLLSTMQWQIVHAPENKSFVTTDNPLVVLPPPDFQGFGIRGYGVKTPGAIKTISLTKSQFLMVGPPGDLQQHGVATKEEVRSLNLGIIQCANCYVYGQDLALVKSLVRQAGLDSSKRGKRLGQSI